jgi:hypothetical protein
LLQTLSAAPVQSPLLAQSQTAGLWAATLVQNTLRLPLTARGKALKKARGGGLQQSNDMLLL